MVAVDLGAWLLAFIATARIDLGPNGAPANIRGLFAFVVVIVVVQCWCGRTMGLYRGRYRVGGYDEAIALAITWAAVATSTALLELALSPGVQWLAETPALFRSSVALTIMAVVRFSWRTLLERELRPGTDGRKRAVVIGAGEAGYLIVRGMLTDPTAKAVPVALLDDSPGKARRTLMGVSVIGTVDDLPRVALETQADLVIIAIPSATSALIRKVVDLSRDTGLEVRTLPPTSELAGSVSMRDVRPINDNDLLGREEVEVDLEQISSYVRDRRVLVTGAGGSIGSELCRQLARLDPEMLLMLDRDESGLHAVQLSIDGRALLDSPSLIVADIRDRERLQEIFQQWRPEVVFHAAALKHLTLLEQHPMEGVKTNVVGTRNVIDAALAAGAERIVNVSTDKAADPSSVLGLTKLMAEQITSTAAACSGTRAVNVRFGNVLSSRGSVVPTFLAQIKAGGPVTVTDPEVTRFFMTIPEAVRLVLQAGAVGDPGETLILDMGQPVKVMEIAQRLIEHHDPSVRIEITGLRPGEKLHEILVAPHENGFRRHHPRVIHTDPKDGLDLQAVVAELARRAHLDDTVGLMSWAGLEQAELAT
ncbi:MAG: nucleoside-diphosphate sugar epimerase/dehydratase [Acidimicrobiales bacterium]